MQIAASRRLRAKVEAKLADKWSPEEISGWLARTYPNNPELQVSHETIYQSLFVQGRGALRHELHVCLRSGRAMRRNKKWTKGGHGMGKIKDMVMISERPAEVEDRAVPGHWEGDLILGKGFTSVGTLVERATRYVILLRLPKDHGAEAVRDAMTKRIVTLPAQLRRTLTWDRARCPSTRGSPSTRVCRSTSVIREARGSAAPMRTQMGSSANTCQRALISRFTINDNSTPSPAR